MAGGSGLSLGATGPTCTKAVNCRVHLYGLHPWCCWAPPAPPARLPARPSLAIPPPQVDRRPLDAAARCLAALQEPSGDWPQQHISGVFNRNCMITYANYR